MVSLQTSARRQNSAGSFVFSDFSIPWRACILVVIAPTAGLVQAPCDCPLPRCVAD